MISPLLYINIKITEIVYFLKMREKGAGSEHGFSYSHSL